MDRPGNPYLFAHLAPFAHQQTAECDAAAEAAPNMVHDAAARQMLAAAGIGVTASASTFAAWQPAAPKTYLTADAAARANLAAAGIVTPKDGAANR